MIYSIKKYDRKLSIKKKLDGSVEITRTSVYNKRKKHDVKTFYNMFSGSNMWILEKLKSMDSTRHDFFTPAILQNKESRKIKKDDRMHKDVAEFIRNGVQFVG